MKIFIPIFSLAFLAILLLVLGLRSKPVAFTAFPESTPPMETISLPADLPAPVARYYRTIVGKEVPIINSAVISTHGTLRFKGVEFPTRFRFIHNAGQGYRHYAESLLFGFPLMKINERYLDGKARMELPVGVIENETKIDMAANLGLWGESIWLPSIFLTDPRVRWEEIDDTTARLVVPFEEGEDSFTVFFDPDTGLIEHLEALRYRDAADAEKILWINKPLGWAEFNGILLPSPAAVIWADEGAPWLTLEIEDVAYNVVTEDYLYAKGP